MLTPEEIDECIKQESVGKALVEFAQAIAERERIACARLCEQSDRYCGYYFSAKIMQRSNSQNHDDADCLRSDRLTSSSEIYGERNENSEPKNVSQPAG